MSSVHFPQALGRNDVFIMRTLDGSNTLFSKNHNATYHSVKGAVSESRHVFIQNGLSSIATPSVRVLEIGFGTGLNAFLAFLFSRSGKSVSYTAVDTHALPPEIVSSLKYPAYLHAVQWEFIFHWLHEKNNFHYETFEIEKLKLLPEGSNVYDCIFFDAFSPDIQPDLWEPDYLSLLFDLTAPGGYFVTYCSKGAVRRTLTGIGFEVERLPGAPGKLHMLRARKPGY